MKKKILSLVAVTGVLLSINGCSGRSNPPSNNNEPKTKNEKIDLAKKTLNELRSQVISVVDYNKTGKSGYLDNEGKNLGDALDKCSLDAKSIPYMISRYTYGNEDNITENWDDGSIFKRTCTISNDIKKCTYEHKKDGKSYNGIITFPKGLSEDFSTNKDELATGEWYGHINFTGTSPASNDNAFDYSTEQEYDLNFTREKTDYGESFILNNASIENNGTKLAVKDLNVSAYYTNNINEEGSYYKYNSITLDGKCGNYETTGTLKALNYINNTNQSKWLPEEVTFDGSLKNSATSGEISGLVDIVFKNAKTVTRDEDMEVSINVNGTLAVPERPKMDIALNYSNSVDKPDTYNNYTADYSYDKTAINIQSIMDKNNKNGNITIKSNNGITFKIIILDGDLVEGDAKRKDGSIVTYKGELIGTLEYRNKVIVVKYLDGSFESIP